MEQLKNMRKKYGLTMKQLGNEIGVAESTISQYESGKREPDYATLIRLADYFNVSVDFLLGRENDDNLTPDIPEAEKRFEKMTNRIKELRQSKKITQGALADYLGIAQNTLSYWEQGKYDIDSESLKKIANYFNTTIDYILNRESNNTASLSISRINAITDRLAEMRLKAGLSRKELAEKSGVSLSVISNLEEGKDGINGQDVDMLARALDTSFDYLMGLSEDSAPPKKSLLAQLADNPPDSQPVAYIFGSNGGRKIITDKNKIDAINAFAELLDKNDSE